MYKNIFSTLSYLFFKYLLFWVGIFSLFKILLYAIYHTTEKINPYDFYNLIYTSLRFDFSVISLFLILQLFLVILFYKAKKSIYSILSIFNIFLILIHNLLAIIDLYLYNSWQSRLNFKALLYLNHPFEVLKNISNFYLFIGIICWLFSSYIIILWYKKNIKHPHNFSFKIKQKITFLAFILIVASLGLRGGWQEIPLNISFAFISQNNLVNYSLVNPIWNIGNLLYEKNSYISKNPYHKMPDSVSDYWTTQYYAKNNIEFIDFFTKDTLSKPNICFLVLEGVNEVCLEPEMPFLKSLKNEGIYFSQCYANGYRTEQGLTSILSGEIPLPYVSIVDNVPAISNYPSLYNDFNKMGYQTQFYFGGESEFGNIKSYLKINKVQKIIDVKNFNPKLRTQKLGVNDSILFKTLGPNLDQLKQPFFNVLMTQSTHEPFDIELNKSETNERNQYLNTVRYLDRSMEQFFKENNTKNWFQNTIFIIISDHSLRLPDNFDNGQREFFKIPLLIVSKRLLEHRKGTTESEILNQTDIPTTLHYLLHRNTSEYPYSRNYFDFSKKHFAHVSFVDGSGIVEDSTYQKHDYRFHYSDVKYQKEHFKGYAILQHIANRFKKQ